MKAMILAAGRGKRMAPLTDTVPKPLLKVAGKPLIQHHIERLRDSGITELVINAAYRADQLVAALGDGHELGVDISWSIEEQALETAGGIRHALPLLGDAPFLLVNGDVWTELDFYALSTMPLHDDLAHLVMIPSAQHHRSGDFHLTPQGRLRLEGPGKQVYAGISVLSPGLVSALEDGASCALVHPLKKAIEADKVSGSLYTGDWVDVGTPERLAALEKRLGHG